MATFTANYNLEKPLQTETYNVDVFNNNMDILDAAIAAISSKLHPVGSVYFNMDGTNPAAKLGGTWVLLDEGKYIRCAGSTIKAGSIGGAESVTLTMDELPAHTHTGSTGSAGAHSHSASADAQGAHSHSGTTGNAGGHNHGFVAYGNVSEGSTDNLNAGGAASGTKYNFTTSSVGDHAHGFSTSTAGAHSHNISVVSAGAHSHTVSISSTGNGKAFSILNPYVALYAFKRTA